MFSKIPLFALLLFILPSTNALAADAPAPRALPAAPEGVVIEQNVSYLAPDRVEKLDLYYPVNRPKNARLPAVVIIHGGGWSGGEKSAGREFNIGTTLAKAGYICASVEYMKDKDKRWPTNLFDCKNAVRFLRSKAEHYQVDVDHIGVRAVTSLDEDGVHVRVVVRLPKGGMQFAQQVHGERIALLRTVQCEHCIAILNRVGDEFERHQDLFLASGPPPRVRAAWRHMRRAHRPFGRVRSSRQRYEPATQRPADLVRTSQKFREDILGATKTSLRPRALGPRSRLIPPRATPAFLKRQ